MHGGTNFIRDSNAIEYAILQNGRRAGFEPDRARSWGWFVRIIFSDREYWQWCEPCSNAETIVMQSWFAQGAISGEPRPTRDSYCVLAAQ